MTASDVAAFNGADGAALRAQLLTITAAPRWAEQLVADRPYADVAALLSRSAEILAGIDEGQVDAALAGHPRIGERAAHGDTDSDAHSDAHAARSAREQAGMAAADAEQVRGLAEANAAYKDRFGRIYLVAAAGLSAQQLLDKARARLQNEPGPELDVVRTELATITRTRLSTWLTEPAGSDSAGPDPGAAP